MERKQATTKAKPRPKKQGDIYDSIWDNVKSLLIAIVLAIIIKTTIAEAYKIPSASMEDTLLVGDFLIANKFVYGARLPFVNWRLPAIRDPKQNDVVIFKYPVDQVTNYIKRCVAVGGQTVEIRDKVLYVDGKEFPIPPHSKFTDPMKIPAPNASCCGGTWDKTCRDNFGPCVVPKGYFFMMGDNRDNSWDSRFWGPVSKDLIQGKAMFIHWSWEPDASSPQVSVTDPLSVPRLFLYNIYHFDERVRWSRLLNIIR